MVTNSQRKRPTFTTTIDKQVSDDFRKACKDNEQKMSDVLETFMKAYAKGELQVESETTFTLKTK